MAQNEKDIAAILLSKGNAIFQAPPSIIKFTGNEAADELLNDIKNYPHAFVLACVMDKQIKAELAWLIPYRISTKLGGFEFSVLEGLSEDNVKDLMTKPEPLHRFPDKMSAEFYRAVQRISIKFNGDSSAIWSDKPSSAKVVYEFLQFDGVGPKIATMATNILARELKVPFSDYYSIDISADIHVRRVLHRLGLIEKGASVEQVVYKARELNPEFPGLIDLPLWEIGRNWCRPKKALCTNCYLKDICSKIDV
jgi:endonuclease-3